jgi:hypothetical protein
MSNRILCFVWTPLTPYKKRSVTAVTWYTAVLVSGCDRGCVSVVLQYSGMVEAPNVFANEEHTHMPFMYGFCNVNKQVCFWDGVHETSDTSQNSTSQAYHTAHSALKQTCFVPRANEERGKKWSEEFDVLSAVQNLHKHDVAQARVRRICTAVFYIRVTFADSRTDLTGRSRQPNAVLWVAATRTTNSACLSVHGSCSIYSRRYL